MNGVCNQGNFTFLLENPLMTLYSPLPPAKLPATSLSLCRYHHAVYLRQRCPCVCGIYVSVSIEKEKRRVPYSEIFVCNSWLGKFLRQTSRNAPRIAECNPPATITFLAAKRGSRSDAVIPSGKYNYIWLL